MQSGNFFIKNREIIDETEEILVPNDDSAKLMYYLYCVSTVLDYDGFGPFIDYKGYYLMPRELLGTLIKFALLFDPKLLIDARVFIEDPDLDMVNRFYAIQDKTMNFNINDEITIGGITTRVQRVMAFKPSFLMIYYYSPLLRLTEPPKQTNINYYPCFICSE